MTDSFDSRLDQQCELSYELLYLLKWLVEQESEALKKIVARAVRNGFKQHIKQKNSASSDIQLSIVDFLDLLDVLLHETLHETPLRQSFHRQLSPAIEKIDTDICDKETLLSSLERATEKLENDPEQNMNDVLYKELLKNWKPPKKKVLH